MLWLPFVLLLSSATASSLISPISDCDEVYNYWEPTHYLLYGSGMQTWEYSPVYGLRSYLYIALHAFFGYLLSPFGDWDFLLHHRARVFFFIRLVLGIAHVLAMSRFVRAVQSTLGSQIALFTTLIAASSPGIFQASVSYLPQSFSMYAVTMAFSSFMDGSRPFGCIFWMGLAGLIGWPFVGILAVCLAGPLVLRYGWIPCLWASLLTASLCLIPSLLVDYYFYRKWMLAVLNIIKYNVFTSHGADLYGVEPWHFYFRNLFLNFNIAWLAFLLVFPLSALTLLLTRDEKATKNTFLGRENLDVAKISKAAKTSITVLWPTVIFLIIFLSMAHKEERFLYPIYPLIALGAASTFYLFAASRIFPLSARLTGSALLFAFVVFSFSRIGAVVSNYNAPIAVYSTIPQGKANVCVGKEWYRFPSSFFLPTADSELLYLKSGFTGLLPRPFSRETNGTRIIPNGMNDLNQEELGRYSEVSQCDYIVDFDLPDQQEPHYADFEEFTIISKFRFLDASRTPWVCRAFYIPLFSDTCVVDGTYQLLGRGNISV